MRRIVEEMMETEAIYVQALADIEDVCDTTFLVTRCACRYARLEKEHVLFVIARAARC
jgi:hypothetical protein